MQRRRAGVKRVWNAQLIAPDDLSDSITMSVEWREMTSNLKLSKQQKGKLQLEKMEKLKDNDVDLPKNRNFGLSQCEFIDMILSIATTKYGSKYDYQFECVDKLIGNHLEGLYQNIVSNESNAISKNESVKKTVQAQSVCLRKLFKIYASLDSDEKVVEKGLGEDEWTAFALSLCNSLKNTSKKIWKNGGKPSFEEISACFILAKPQSALDSDEIDFKHFQKCIVNFTNVMFKITPNPKYEIVSFSDKLDMVLDAIQKMEKDASKMGAAHYKKAKTMRESTPIGTPTNNNAPSEFPTFSASD